MSETPDYYQILQVHPEADPLVIKKAYRTLMVAGGHPDHGGQDSRARRLTEAYEVLTNPERRRAYDRERRKAGRADAGVQVITLCPHCGVQNRISSRTKLLVAKCGDCGRPLGRVKLPPTRLQRRLRIFSLVMGSALLLFALGWGGTQTWKALRDPLRLASALERQDRVSEAIALLRETLGRDPDSAGAWTLLARDLAWQHRDREAAEACERRVNLEPRSAAAWLALGRARSRCGDWSMATTALGHARKLSPSEPEILLALAEVFQRSNRAPEAVKVLQAAARMASRDGEVWFRLGRALVATRDLASAIAAYRQGLAVAPLRADGWRELSRIHRDRQEKGSYQAALEKAVRLDPQDPRSHLDLAELYRVTGHPGLAIREYRTVLSLDPGDPAMLDRVRRSLTELGG